MMKRTALYATISLSLLLGRPVRAQSFAEAIDKTNAFYRDTPELSVSVRTMMYKRASDPKPEHTIMGSFSKRMEEYRIDVGPRTFLSNTRCGLVVDRENRLMVFSGPEKSKETKGLLNEFSNPDSLMKAPVNISPVQSEGERLVFEIVPKRHNPATGEPAKTVVTLNRADFSLYSVVYTFREHPSAPYAKIVIRYTHRTGPESVADKSFSESRYVTGRGSKMLPTPEFKEFKVILQEKNPPKIY